MSSSKSRNFDRSAILASGKEAVAASLEANRANQVKTACEAVLNPVSGKYVKQIGETTSDGLGFFQWNPWNKMVSHHGCSTVIVVIDMTSDLTKLDPKADMDAEHPEIFKLRELTTHKERCVDIIDAFPGKVVDGEIVPDDELDSQAS